MFEKSMIGIFIAESPIHCGAGQELGVVDLPIQREDHTNYPKIPGSEIKGSFKQHFKGDSDFSTSVGFGDAKILFFPVKSLKGTYVWITSKDVLDKFGRTLKLANIGSVAVPSVPALDNEHIIIYNNLIAVDDKVVLEEYMFTKQDGKPGEFNPLIDKIVPDVGEYKYLNESLKKKLCIVSDDMFRDFTEMSTEVAKRIRIDTERGVASSGALWSEEYLPADSILYFPAFVPKEKAEKVDSQLMMDRIKIVGPYLQVGGDETIGKGFVRVNWIN